MANLRYFIEFRLDGSQFKPVGFQAQDSETNQVEVGFIPGMEDEEVLVKAPLFGLIEANQLIPPDYLEWSQEAISPYKGQRGEIRATTDFDSLVALGERLQQLLQQGAGIGSYP